MHQPAELLKHAQSAYAAQHVHVPSALDRRPTSGSQYKPWHCILTRMAQLWQRNNARYPPTSASLSEHVLTRHPECRLPPHNERAIKFRPSPNPGPRALHPPQAWLQSHDLDVRDNGPRTTPQSSGTTSYGRVRSGSTSLSLAKSAIITRWT